MPSQPVAAAATGAAAAAAAAAAAVSGFRPSPGYQLPSFTLCTSSASTPGKIDRVMLRRDGGRADEELG